MASKKDAAKKNKQRNYNNNAMMDNAPSSGGKRYLKLPKGLKYFVPEVNKTYRLRFLAWPVGAGNPAGKGNYAPNRYLFVHANVGPNDERVACASKMQGKPCPICDQFSKKRKRGKDWDDIKDLRPKNREMFLVHDVNDRDSTNLMVWEESTYMFGDYLRAKIASKPKYQRFADPEKGWVVEVTGKKKAIGANSCTEFTNIDFEEGEPLSEELLERVDGICLDDYIHFDTYEAVKKLANAIDSDDEDDEPEEEEDDEDEGGDEDEEDEPEEEDDEDDEPVAKKPVKKPVKKPGKK